MSRQLRAMSVFQGLLQSHNEKHWIVLKLLNIHHSPCRKTTAVKSNLVFIEHLKPECIDMNTALGMTTENITGGKKHPLYIHNKEGRIYLAICLYDHCEPRAAISTRTRKRTHTHTHTHTHTQFQQ